MKINNFEDIIAWQKSKDLGLRLYKSFGRHADYGFRDQILRAVISIANNIAEGFERRSNKELRQFLFIAKGSCGEVRSMLYFASELGYITSAELDSYMDSSIEISKLLSGFIKTL